MSWFHIALLCGVSFFFTRAFVTPGVRRIALAKGWVDDPTNGGRKLHAQAIPYLGGAAVYLGFILGFSILFIFFPHLRAATEVPHWFVAFLIGGVLVLVVGTLDDIFDIPAVRKLLAQILIAILIYFGGIQLDHIVIPPWGMIELSQWSAVLTVFVFVGAMNAVNLIDGLDGLASGVVFLAAIANTLLAWHLGNTFLLVVSLLLAASLFGFLMHNTHPATIFLGDGGSLLLGFLTAGISIENVQQAGKFSETIIPLLALIYPIIDVGIAMLRRVLKGKPVMSADLAHLHHRMLERGMMQQRVVMVICGFTTMAILAGFFFVWGFTLAGGIAISFLAVFFLAGLFVLKFFDVTGARVMMRLRPLFKIHNAYKQLLVVRMRYAGSEDELWQLIIDAAREFQLRGVAWREASGQRLFGQSNGTGNRQTVVMEKTQGEIEFILPEHVDNDLRLEVDTLMRALIKTMDKMLRYLRHARPSGSDFHFKHSPSYEFTQRRYRH